MARGGNPLHFGGPPRSVGTACARCCWICNTPKPPISLASSSAQRPAALGKRLAQGTQHGQGRNQPQAPKTPLRQALFDMLCNARSESGTTALPGRVQRRESVPRASHTLERPTRAIISKLSLRHPAGGIDEVCDLAQRRRELLRLENTSSRSIGNHDPPLILHDQLHFLGCTGVEARRKSV